MLIVDWPRVIKWGVPAALLVIAAVGLEPWFRKHPVRLLVYFGDASYSIYLWNIWAGALITGAMLRSPIPTLLRPEIQAVMVLLINVFFIALSKGHFWRSFGGALERQGLILVARPPGRAFPTDLKRSKMYRRRPSRNHDRGHFFEGKMRSYTLKEIAKITAGAVAALVIVAWLLVIALALLSAA